MDEEATALWRLSILIIYIQSTREARLFLAVEHRGGVITLRETRRVGFKVYSLVKETGLANLSRRRL